MLYPDLIDIPVDLLGGYVCAMPPSDLSPGAAAIAQDVMFPQGALRTRGGLLNFFGAGSPIPANASVNGLKSYITPTLQKRLLAWDNLGNFYKETPQGTLNLLATRPYVNLLYNSQSLFGREYQAFFNSLGGFDIPRQYDDTNWDRVSQVGPGIAPDATDENFSFTIVAAPNGAQEDSGNTAASPTGLTQVGNIVTVTMAGPITEPLAGSQVIIAGATNPGYNGTFTILQKLSNTQFTYIATITGLPGDGGATASTSVAVFTTATNHTFVVGQLATIAGVGVGGYNGTWKVTKVISATQFTAVIPTAGLGTSGSGTASLAGSIVAGLHQISVAYITRQGYITKAAVPKSWTAAGSKRVIVTNIPTGPVNIVGRLLLFTAVITAPAVTGPFFSLPNGSTQIFTSMMLISDNTTTTTTVDFTDTVLIAGFSANYLFTQNELGECAFMIPYNARTVWLGERNKVQNLVNPTFDGGFNAALTIPDGWTPDPANNGGGSSAIAGGWTADWADAYQITGDGVTAIRGKITQSAFQDYLGVAIIGNTTSYSVRGRVARTPLLVQGTLHINLQSTSGGFTTAGLAVTAAQAGLAYAEFTAVITAALASPPADLLLQVYADGTPSLNGAFLVDSIEIYPTPSPFNYSTARFSHAFNPESFDATTGQLQVRPSDGTQLQAGFPLRANLYLAKDHYLCYVTDDGVNEPASWAVNEVSNTVGICGPNAVDWTEEWATFAERSGLYVFFGGDPVKITPEIQTDASGTGKISWQSINWQFGNTIWVRIDKVNKMILVGAPTGKGPDGGLATTPNTVFMFDYKWLEGGQDIASSPMVTYSQFTGKILSHGRGRRCAIWTITANSMCFAERADETVQPFFGNGSRNGKIYQQIDCALQPTDDGVAIPWQYQGYGAPSAMEEQQFQMSGHRKLCGFMSFRSVGVGLMPLAIVTAQRTTVLRPYALSLAPVADGNRRVNVHSERFFAQIGPNTVAGSWMQTEKLLLCVKKDASIPVGSGVA